MNHTLEADGIQFSYGARRILGGIYIRCQSGKLTGLLGRNGQGKSTLLKIIFGTLPCEKSVRINGRSVNQLLAFQHGVRYMPQFHFLPKHLSVKRILRDYNVSPEELINWFPLFEGKLSKTVNELSGGQRRMLELCIIALPPAACILLDEPFTHLDPVHIQTAKDLLMQQKHHKAVLVTDQMYDHLTDVCDQLYLLANGKTHAISSMADLKRLGYIGG